MPRTGNGARDIRQQLPILLWTAWGALRLFGVAAAHGSFPYGHVVRGTAELGSYFRWSDALWHGAVPYRDIRHLYPPGILPALALPPLSLRAYEAEFLVLAILVDALVLRALLRTGRTRGATLWVLAAPLLGPVFWTRLDILVAGALVAAVLAWDREDHGHAGAWLAVAGLMKIWPFVLVALFVWRVPPERRRSFVLGATAVTALAVVPFVVLGGSSGLWESVGSQAGRGVEYESIFALPLYVAQALGHGLPPVMHPAAVEFTGVAASTVRTAATVLFVTAIVACLWRSVSRRTDLAPAEWLVIVVAVLLVTDQVFSVQYMVWAAAAVALFVDSAPRRGRLFLCACVTTFMAQLQFPWNLGRMMAGGTGACVISALHAASVVALAWVIFRAVARRRDRVSIDVTPERRAAAVRCVSRCT